MSPRILLTVAAILVFSPMSIPAADNGPAPKKNGAGAKDPAKDKETGGEAGDKKDTYAVVQIGNDVVKVCKDSELGAVRDKVNEDYKAAVKAYEDGKKAAVKAKKKFSDVKPVKPNVKVIASYIKTEQEANTLRDKTLQKLEGQKKKEKEDHPKGK
jgi:hypothetical protein